MEQPTTEGRDPAAAPGPAPAPTQPGPGANGVPTPDPEQKASAAAAEREVETGPVVIEHEGLRFEIPRKAPFNMMRVLASAGNEAQLAVKTLELLLGGEQLQQVWDANLDMDSGRELTEKILDNYGTSLGKFSASSR